MFLVFWGLYIDVLSVFMRFSVIMCIYETYLKIYFWICSNISIFRFLKTCVVIIFDSNQELGWSLSDRGDEVSMCNFKELCFWLKSIILEHRGS